ncbi:RDD family protein [Anaerolineae bacterium CFX9]|nr:RDD family protein [Anaerolineae bacterium CFX9]
MSDLNEDIRAAIDTFDLARARELLRDALKEANAETYYLASRAALDEDQKRDFLEKAVALDPFHEKARLALKGNAPASAPAAQPTSPVSQAGTPHIVASAATPTVIIKGESYEIAEHGTRFVAYLIDFLAITLFSSLVAAVNYLVAAIATNVFGGYWYMEDREIQALMTGISLTAGLAAVIALYSALPAARIHVLKFVSIHVAVIALANFLVHPFIYFVYYTLRSTRPDDLAGFAFFMFIVLMSVGIILINRLLPNLFETSDKVPGQTIGKKMTHLQIMPTSGEMSLGKSFGRFIGWLLATSFVIGFFWPLFDQQRRGLHDIASNTFVVKASNSQ